MAANVIELLIPGREKDLGGFKVRRVLPYAKRKSVGPFIFWDHLGPVDLLQGRGMDVGPHPHIGLSTVTYLFEGTALHRDSLGNEQVIRPGDINWMTAGKGIAHSERTPEEMRQAKGSIHGIQVWVALPKTHEEVDPAFYHHPAPTIPEAFLGGVQARILIGSAFGHTSPVQTFTNMFYVELLMPASSTLQLERTSQERAIYVVDGEADVAGHSIKPATMAVLSSNSEIELKARQKARVMLLGGDPLDGPREIWWNFVSSSKARIEQAKRDWAAGRFSSVPHESEVIPLPES